MSIPPPGFTEIDEPGPFLAHVGPLYTRTGGDGGPVLGLHAADEHANASGAVHGGLLATLCDAACGQRFARAPTTASAARSRSR